MDNALAEFARQGYGASSVNAVCSAQGISKGIIYHYFKTKDTLHLACVEECFGRLTEYLRANSPVTGTTESRLEGYFSARMDFFRAHPVYRPIFCEAIISPPAHLAVEIQARKQPLTILISPFWRTCCNRFLFALTSPWTRWWTLSDSFRILSTRTIRQPLRIPGNSVCGTDAAKRRWRSCSTESLTGRTKVVSDKTLQSRSVLGEMQPSKAIIKLAVPATLALLAKAAYNIVDTAYIGMLNSDIALTAVGVTVPLLLILVSIENIFAAGAAVLADRQLGQQDHEGASRTVTTLIGLSMILDILMCAGGIAFIEPLMRAFGASDASLPFAKDYAFWMFVAALANLPAQSMNCAARAESSVRISSVAVITGAVLNIILDPVFMFDWGLNMGVEGASLATTISRFSPFSS